MRFLKHQKYRIYTIYTKLTPNGAGICAEKNKSHNFRFMTLMD